MKKSSLGLAGVLLVCSLMGPSSAAANPGVRRGEIGLTVKSPRQIDQLGAEVATVEMGSAANASGLRPGDLIQSWDGKPIKGPVDFAAAVARSRAGQTHRLEIRRHGQPLVVTITVQEAMREQPNREHDVAYTWFKASDATMLRAVVTSPTRRPGRLPAMVIIPGLGGKPCDDPGMGTQRGLARALARSGWVVVRWDQRGAGDSYGTEYSDVSFEREVQDAIDVLRNTQRLPGVDQSRVYIFGFGTGGVIGAHAAAAQNDVAGLITWGTISRPLVEYLVESAREQGRIAGLAAPEINRQVRLIIRFYERLLAGADPRELVRKHEQLRGFSGPDGYVQGKTAQYWRDLDSTLYWQLYGQSRVPALALYAEHDFVSSPNDQDNIVALAAAAGRGDVHAVVVPGTDHHMNTTVSRADSYNKLRIGEFTFNPIGVNAVLKWTRKLEQWRQRAPATTARRR